MRTTTIRPTWFSILAAVLLVCSQAVVPAVDAKAAESESEDSAAGNYVLKGFRSLEFGMSEDQVKRALVNDFGVAQEAMRIEENPVQKTRAVVAELPMLEPGPGRAILSCILGYRSQRLIQINIMWGGQDGSEDTASLKELVSTARLFSDYLKRKPWPDGNARQNLLRNRTSFVLFQAEDKERHAVDLSLNNVSIQIEGQDDDPETGQSKGPPFLLLSYIKDPKNPDVFSLKEGEF